MKRNEAKSEEEKEESNEEVMAKWRNGVKKKRNERNNQAYRNIMAV